MSKFISGPPAWSLRPADFALLRTPLKPVGFLAAPAAGADARLALSSRLAVLAECVRDPIALAAITHASASLGSRACTLDPQDPGKENLKLAVALYKYVTRLSRRATPFGLMAAVSVLEVGESTCVMPDPAVRLHARVDNAYTARISRALCGKLLRERNRNFRIRANNTAHVLPRELRRVARVGADASRYRLGAVRRTREIDFILAEVADGIQSGRLVARMSEELACHEDEAWEFLEGLIDHEVLHTDVEMVLTSGDCFDALGDTIARIPGLEKQASSVSTLRTRVEALERIDGNVDGHVRQVAEGIARILEEDPGSIANPVHLDAYRSAAGSTLARSELEELAENLAPLLEVLWRAHGPLQAFAKAFVKRFGDAEVPLLEALDADTGICFGPPRSVSSPLLGGALAPTASATIELEWDAWRQFLLERILQAASRNEHEIVLERDELARYSRPSVRPSTNVSLAVHVSLLGPQDESGAPTMLLRGLYGPSAANLLGRFTCGDAVLAAKVRGLADHEQTQVPGRLAEVVHVPAGKTANVLARTCIRDTEILYGPVNAGAPHALTCGDLLLSVYQGRLRLRSRHSGEEILPRLASAHFTGAHNLPVYQFLAAMQHVDGRAGPLLDSKLFDRLPHIPRIRIGSLVASPARWRLDASESEHFARNRPVEAQMEAARALRASRGLPRWVALVQGDNLLDIDLEDPLAVLALASELRGMPAVLCESMVAMDRGGASLGGQPAANELIVPMHLSVGGAGKVAPPLFEPSPIAAVRAARERPLERWVYLEIFTGESSAERLLVDAVEPCMRSLQAEGRLAKWFYVRYYDGDEFHLRLRMLPAGEGGATELADGVLRLFDPWIGDGIVHHMRICGYEPELDRYGGPGSMPLCEEIFHLHSEVAVQVLRKILGSPDQEDRRWLASAVLVWETLVAVYPDLSGLADFAAAMVKAYRGEMPASAGTTKAISSNYRAHRAVLERALEGRGGEGEFDPIREPDVRTRRRAALEGLASRHEGARLAGIVASLVHMDCNRLFPFSPRANEMMVYEYLGRYARSRLARTQEAAAVPTAT